MALPVVTLIASLIANWVASENIIGLTGTVACKNLVPAILLDPIGAAFSLVVFGFLLGPYAGQHTSLSSIVIERYGVVVGGIGSALSVFGSLLWAAAQYKAVIELVQSSEMLSEVFVEPIVACGLLLWTIVGGLTADVWFDFLSVLIVAPLLVMMGMRAVAAVPSEILTAEADHTKATIWSSGAVNSFAVGMLGNLFTEELAGRILLAKSCASARISCFTAALLFAIIGLAPAALGLWARGMPSALMREDGTSMCKDSQDKIISTILPHLLPSWLKGAQQLLSALLIIESLNTVDTSILMCANVLESQVVRAVPAFQTKHTYITSIVASLAVVMGVSRAGENVWELAESATASGGAPLAVLCIFLRWKFGGAKAGLLGMGVSSITYVVLNSGESTQMPYICSMIAGVVAYILTHVLA